MPQYNDPALGLTSAVAANDLFLFWVDAVSGNKGILGSDLAAALKALMTFVDDPVIVTTNTTLTGAYSFVIANSGAGITITLPSANAFPGQRFRIANKGAGNLTVARSGSDTISGNTSVTLAQYKAYEFESDGAGVWYQFGA
jgi:hypothetical protein